VLKWPDGQVVEKAMRAWAAETVPLHKELRRLGYYGSYARGDWGVGSDLDLIAIVCETSLPFERRGLSWNLSSLPVPAEIVVYTEGEWKKLNQEQGLFVRTVEREAVWIYEWPADRVRV
jgi:predicted nucleotidyltransferase